MYLAIGRSFSTHLFLLGLTCTGRSRFVPRRFSIPSHYARQRGDPLNVIPSVAVVGNCRSQLQIRTHSCAILNWSRVEAWLPGIFCKRELPRFLPVWYGYSKILVNSMFFGLSHPGISLKHIIKTSTICRVSFLSILSCCWIWGIIWVRFWSRPFSDAQLQHKHTGRRKASVHTRIYWHPKPNRRGKASI